MKRMLVSRISRRVLAEHHLALTDGLARNDTSPQRAQVGIIHTALDVKASVERCISLLQERPQGADANFETMGEGTLKDSPSRSDHRWPEVILDGDLDTRFAYIKEHFEYIVFELLKNVRLAHLTPFVYRHAKSTPSPRAGHAAHCSTKRWCGRARAHSCDDRGRSRYHERTNLRPRWDRTDRVPPAPLSSSPWTDSWLEQGEDSDQAAARRHTIYSRSRTCGTQRACTMSG